jgi:hypothetical protein
MADPFSGNVGGTAGTAWLTDIQQGMGIAQDIQQGGLKGDIQAAQSAAKLGSNLGMFGSSSSAVGGFASDVANLGNIIQGIQQGGVAGYGGAAVNAAALAARTGALGGMSGAIGAVAGPLAGAVSLYQFAQNWQSGNTGGDALRGAQTGATIGAVVGPEGALVGAVIGGAVGAISSAFGGGKADPETMALENYAPQFNKDPTIASSLTAAQNMTMLAGVFDAKNNSPGHSTPLEQYYGRMGEQAFTNDIFSQINSAMQSGKVSPLSTAQTLYQQVVAPYLASKSANGQSLTIGAGNSWTTAHGTPFANAMQAAVVGLIGQWQSGAYTSKTVMGAGNTTNPPAYQGWNILQSKNAQAGAANIGTQLQALMAALPIG